MSELREARGPRPQRLKWTSAVLRSLSLVSTCLGNENKVRPQRHTLVIFCSASLIEKNGILACYQDKKNYTKNQNKQTNKKQTRKRKIFSNAEIQCLEQNSVVLMLTAEDSWKEHQSFFPIFWRMWSHTFSFKLGTPLLEIIQHLQMILTAVNCSCF